MSASPGADRRHLLLAIVVGGLLLGGPWLALYRRVPDEAGWIAWSHVLLGLAVLPLAAAYAWSWLRDGRAAESAPVGRRRLAAVGRDLAGLARGRIPSAERGGLLGLVAGLLLLAVLASAATGLGWLLAQGGDSALAWREAHRFAVRGLVGMLALHVVGVVLHVLELLRA